VIPNRLPEPVSLHLVNPDTGRPIQTWLFEAQKSVRIGRAEGNDVVISDPSVSRFHAELQFNGVEWELVNLGKNGTLISSHSISRVKIDQQTLFRLGTGGPLLRFERSGEAFDTLNTVMNAVAPPQPIQIDECQKESQVRAIVESDYFQHLQGIFLKASKAEFGIALTELRVGSLRLPASR
jgi:pSer/pThr/pTyr-binding forkhead associated (FHA) protein